MAPPDYSAWLEALLRHLDDSGPEAAAALRFIGDQGTRIGLHDQPTGARWTLDRRIEIHPRYAQSSPDDPFALGLIIHEVRHLQQGLPTALSVYGELEAWQLQFGFLKSRTGRYHPEPRHNSVIEHLMSLSLGWDRTMLGQARSLMQAYAGSAYRIDLLPYYPLPAEVLFHILGTQPRGDIRNRG